MSCSTGKVQHSTQSAADAHALSIQKKDGHLPFIYTCKECGFLHVGGGRKSDRPVYFQPSKVPVLPPVELPRKKYERRKAEAGVSFEVRDVVIEYILAHLNATDREVARVFGIKHNVAYDIRTRAKIPAMLKRREQRVLAELKKDPSAPRPAIAKACAVTMEVVGSVVHKHGFAGTGRKALPGPKNPLFGKRFSTEIKAKFKAAQQKRWDDAPPETRARNADHCRKILNPQAFVQWARRNPEKARLIAQAAQKKAQLLHPEKVLALRTPEALAKRSATYKAKTDKKRELIEALLKQGMFSQDIAKQVSCGFGLIVEVRKGLGLLSHTRIRQRTPEEREAFSIKCSNAWRKKIADPQRLSVE